MELRIGSAEFDAQGTPSVRIGFCEFDALGSIDVRIGFCEFDSLAPFVDDSITIGGGYEGGSKPRARLTRSGKKKTLTQEVAALAKSLEPVKKLTKTDKRKRRDEIVAEVIKQLPDVPNVEEVAPVIAQAVVRREAQLAAMPKPVTPAAQRTDIASVIEQQIAKYRAKVRYDSHVDDESEIEMLLLG